MKINPTIIILITGTLLANIVYFKVDTQSTQMVIILDGQICDADTFQPIEVNGTLHKIGWASWSGVNSAGEAPLYEVRGPPYGTYIMITTIIATLLTWAITKYREPIQEKVQTN